ncbi:hypothetical protein GBA52_011647 [Prunus armeniaca]|nr:hypothetical protein GBA52_011647 [Prunus armeniaca]
MEDILEPAVNLVENLHKEGFDEGYGDGLVAGKEEAKEVGLKHGFEVGEELGFYRGCLDVWNSAIRVDLTPFSLRVQKGVKQMEELIEKYPVMEPEDESVQDVMEALRLKFRAVCASMATDEQGGEKMLKSMLGCCKVYISESRNRAALEGIERAAKLFSEAPIVNKFEDETYNRVGYTLVSKLAPKPSEDPCTLRMAVLAMWRTVGWGAKIRILGAEAGQGTPSSDSGKGVIVIGATRWVDNYNVPVFSTDIAAVRRIAKRVSGRGGGLPSVQAMALAHGESVIEVACNLLEPEKVGGDRVQLEVERLSEEEGIRDKKKKTIDQSMLLCCKLYISESRNHAALDAIERAARLDPESVIVNKFEDRAYNRVRYTIVSYVMHDSTGSAIYSPLQQTVMAMAEAAFGAINLEQHSGAHPRLGVIDNTLSSTHWLGHLWMKRLGLPRQWQWTLAIGSKLSFILIAVPVYLYAAAHPTGKALDTIRRELGYYRPNFMGSQWAGWTMPEILHEKPDEGPTSICPARGISMIGHAHGLPCTTYPYCPRMSQPLDRIARMVSARGADSQPMQTLGLVHGEDSTEIACMLLEPNQIGGTEFRTMLRC